MAEGYLRHVAGDAFESLSAGDVREFLGQYVPHVITVCDTVRERCPIFPKTYSFRHWPLPDPAVAEGSHDEKLAVFRRVRDEITRRIDEELVAPLAEQRSSSTQ